MESKCIGCLYIFIISCLFALAISVGSLILHRSNEERINYMQEFNLERNCTLQLITFIDKAASLSNSRACAFASYDLRLFSDNTSIQKKFRAVAYSNFLPGECSGNVNFFNESQVNTSVPCWSRANTVPVDGMFVRVIGIPDVSQGQQVSYQLSLASTIFFSIVVSLFILYHVFICLLISFGIIEPEPEPSRAIEPDSGDDVERPAIILEPEGTDPFGLTKVEEIDDGWLGSIAVNNAYVKSVAAFLKKMATFVTPGSKEQIAEPRIPGSQEGRCDSSVITVPSAPTIEPLQITSVTEESHAVAADTPSDPSVMFAAASSILLDDGEGDQHEFQRACCVCFEPSPSLLMAVCGHFVCDVCVEKLLRTESRKTGLRGAVTCPMCRSFIVPCETRRVRFTPFLEDTRPRTDVPPQQS